MFIHFPQRSTVFSHPFWLMIVATQAAHAMAGWMERRGPTADFNWQRRWVVLQCNGRLETYLDQEPLLPSTRLVGSGFQGLFSGNKKGQRRHHFLDVLRRRHRPKKSKTGAFHCYCPARRSASQLSLQLCVELAEDTEAI